MCSDLQIRDLRPALADSRGNGVEVGIFGVWLVSRCFALGCWGEWCRFRGVESGGIDERTVEREAPWRAGLRAARANVAPGLLVQGMMLGLLLAYYFHPPTRVWLEELAVVKSKWGFLYSFLASVLAGALAPELLRIIVFQKGRLKRGNLSNFLFAAPFWGSMGVLVDGFYRLQAIWWGDEAIPSVVIPQVLLDQFIFSPFLTGPLTVCLYDWKNRGYRVRRSWFTKAYYRDQILPTVVAIWGVWIPIVTVLYTLPETLQVPLYSMALTLWVMLYTWMSEEASEKLSRS